MSDIGEAELLDACQSGTTLDGAAAGLRRTVPADVLRRCCRELASQVDPRGLQLTNMLVTGCLDLAGLDVAFPLRFDNCVFDAAPTVAGAQLFELSVNRCELPGLLGNGLRLRRNLDLSGSQVSGLHWTSASTSTPAAIWLAEADIGGSLMCVDTVIEADGGRAMHADRIHVGGAVGFVRNFTARGQIRLVGARIGGSLDLIGAQIEADADPALTISEATIGGTVRLIDAREGRPPVVRGRISMSRARVGGELLIRNATLGDPAHGADRVARPEPDGTFHEKPGLALTAPRLSVGAELTFAGQCEVSGGIELAMAELSGVLIGSRCALRAPGRTALNLTNAELQANFRLDDDAVVEGTIRLAGAVIHGSLALQGHLSKPEHRSLFGGTALVVDGDVVMERLEADGGRVNFRGAVLGSLIADGAQLSNPDGYSLVLTGAIVKGPVHLIGVTSSGKLMLNRATIEGRLRLSGGSFSCPGRAWRERGHAIEAISATVRGGMDLGWAAVSPSVDFTDATTTFLADDPAAWPERFTIAGLTYHRFENPQGAPSRRVWDEDARCAWLDRQTVFDSGPYEQAARVFRQHGYIGEAEQILIAQRRRARQVDRPNARWPGRAADRVYRFLGYGYRPSRVLWLLAALLVLVAASLALPASQATLRATNGNGAVYGTTGLLATGAGPVPAAGAASRPVGDACGDGEVRCFSPVLYAIDTVIPLISLDQRSTWYPDPNLPGGQVLLWWLNLATLLGWLLSSVFVLSLARLARSP